MEQSPTRLRGSPLYTKGPIVYPIISPLNPNSSRAHGVLPYGEYANWRTHAVSPYKKLVCVCTGRRGNEVARAQWITTQCVVRTRVWPSRSETADPYGVWCNFLRHNRHIANEMATFSGSKAQFLFVCEQKHLCWESQNSNTWFARSLVEFLLTSRLHSFLLIKVLRSFFKSDKIGA